jgi:type I restriction enzyme, R subunit
VHRHAQRQGKGFVDYVLWGDDGKPLALVEAKRTTRDAKVGQQQAKLYADCLERCTASGRSSSTPTATSTGSGTTRMYPPRAVQGFYKKDELELLVQRRSSRKPLAERWRSTGRSSSATTRRAPCAASAKLRADNQRKALVVMATGAGKTRTVIALADLLMRANWAKRVLFLADRVALVNQAVNAFKAHLPDSAPVNLVTDKHTEGRVFVSTYPTMMG